MPVHASGTPSIRKYFEISSNALGEDKEGPDPGQFGGQPFDNSIGETILIGIGGHIVKGQHGNRRFVRQHQRLRGDMCLCIGPSKDPDFAGYVFECPFACICKYMLYLAVYVLMGRGAEDNGAGRADYLYARSDIYVFTKNIRPFQNDIGQIVSELNAIFFSDP